MPSGFRFVTRRDGGTLRDGELMRAPYGLEIIESCLICPHREDRLFCDLPPAALQGLAAITSPAAYPKGATLFVEGQPSRGGFRFMRWPGQAFHVVRGWEEFNCQNRGNGRGSGFARHCHWETL